MSVTAGVQKDRSYPIVNGRQVTSNIFTPGVNVPGKSGWFNHTVGCRLGERGRAEYLLVKEKFAELTLNISLGNMFLNGARKYN